MTLSYPPKPHELKTLRLSLGLTQRQIADMVGVTQPAWQRYERGHAKMSRPVWEMLRIHTAMDRRPKPTTNSATSRSTINNNQHFAALLRITSLTYDRPTVVKLLATQGIDIIDSDVRRWTRDPNRHQGDDCEIPDGYLIALYDALEQVRDRAAEQHLDLLNLTNICERLDLASADAPDPPR